MTQGVSDRPWQADVRTAETKQFIRDIKRITHRKFNAEEKIRIVLEGFRRDTPIRDLCRREGIRPSTYYAWLKDFMEAGKERLTRDITRDATRTEIHEIKRENARLKTLVAELSLQVHVFKKKRQRRIWNKGEVYPGERYRKERDSIPGSRFRTAAAKGSGTAGTGKEHLLSLAKAASLREVTGQERRFDSPPGTSSGPRKRRRYLPWPEHFLS